MKKIVLILILAFAALYSCVKSDVETPRVERVSTLPVSGVLFDIVQDSTEVTFNGEVTFHNSEKVLRRGFIWSEDDQKTFKKDSVPFGSDGRGQGTFSKRIMLGKDKVNYVKAYIVTASGTYFGELISFNSSTEPIVEDRTDYLAVTATRLDLEGSVTSDGGTSVTSYGAYWGTSPDDLTEVEGEGLNEQGNYTVALKGLSEQTKYYVCLYTRNATGEKRSALVDFTTGALTDPVVIFDAGLPASSNATGITVSGIVRDRKSTRLNSSH